MFPHDQTRRHAGPALGPRRFLLAAPFVDELLCAFAVVGLPLIRDGLGLSYAQAGMLLSIGGLTGMVFEPLLLALANRGHQGRWLGGALLVNIACCAVAAITPGYAVLLLAFAVLGVTDGLALCLAEAMLIAREPEHAERLLLRWALAGSIGDLLGPLVVAGLMAGSVGWRGLFVAAAAIWVAYLATASRRGVGCTVARLASTERRHTSLRVAFRRAHAAPGLARWAMGLVALVLLDEVVVAFAGLYLRDVVGAGPSATALALGAGMAGTVVSLVVLERKLTGPSLRRTFVVSALLCSVSLAVLLLWPSMVVAVPALLIAGAAGAPLFPVMSAQAYRALPGEPALVQAYLACWAPIGVALPWLVGLIADSAGLVAGLACIAVAPLVILAVVPLGRLAGDPTVTEEAAAITAPPNEQAAAAH